MSCKYYASDLAILRMMTLFSLLALLASALTTALGKTASAYSAHT